MKRSLEHWMSAAMVMGVLVVCGSLPAQTVRDGFVEALPVFTSGPHTNKHAVYQHEKFVAWMDGKGVLWVQPLDGGKPVGRAFSCHTVVPYYSAKGATWAREMERFQEPSAPVVIPAKGGKLRIKGRVEGDIPFVAEYTFEGNAVKATGGCQDKPTTKPPSNFRLLTRFAATHRFAVDTPEEQVRVATEGMTLEVRPLSGSAVVYPYWKAIKTLYGPYSAMIVRGAFGPRVLTFKPTGKEGVLRGYIYENRAPWQGFYVQYITQGKKINLAANEVVLIVE
ncbi:MAG: hypothetical protein N3B01_11210 [Verrucomicrobiae bacterium]|nr:hypothetical protein [Verrucomicrobiae bacterium]